MARRWIMVALAAAALAAMPAVARADGDPASDVLLSQPLFLPADAGVPAGRAGELASLLPVAARSGYPIRVALISSPADLGSVTALWLAPQSYAHFLEEELAPSYRGRVLVVMPNGTGLYSAGRVTPAERAAATAIRAPGGSGAALLAAAIDGVRAVAAAAGHALPAAPAGATGSARGGSGDLVAWMVFALGGILIVVAWTWSLRVRPLQVGRGRPAP